VWADSLLTNQSEDRLGPTLGRMCKAWQKESGTFSSSLALKGKGRVMTASM